jgi:hypothetical protein
MHVLACALSHAGSCVRTFAGVRWHSCGAHCGMLGLTATFQIDNTCSSACVHWSPQRLRVKLLFFFWHMPPHAEFENYPASQCMRVYVPLSCHTWLCRTVGCLLACVLLFWIICCLSLFMLTWLCSVMVMFCDVLACLYQHL